MAGIVSVGGGVLGSGGSASVDESITATYNQQAGGGASEASGSNSLSQSINLGSGASFSLEQTSPGALAALQATAANAIQGAGDMARTSASLASGALETAKNALTPESQRASDLVKYLSLAAVALAAFWIWRRR